MRIVVFLLACSCAVAAPKFVRPPVVSANPNPAVPLAAVLTFTADQPVSTAVAVSDGKHSWQLTYDASHRPENGLAVIGMRPDRKHRIEVQIRDAAGNTTAASQFLEFTTPALPSEEGEFPPVRITVHKPDRMEPGYTLFNPRRERADDRRFGANFGMILIVDDAGVPVWYYRTNFRITQQTRLRDGNIAYMTQDFRIAEIDWLGNVVRQWYSARRPQGAAPDATPVDTVAFHHSLAEMPSGNIIALSIEIREIDNYYTSDTDPNAPRKRQKVVGDEVVEFQPDGKIVWRWSALDSLDPFRIGYGTFGPYWLVRGFKDVADWSHGNKLMYDSSDDSVLVSFRQLSAIVKIGRKNRDVKWIFADPKGWNEALAPKLLKLDAGRWFYTQHALTTTPEGTLLIFDNANLLALPFDPPVRPRDTYSRAVEFRIDENRKVAREVWASEEQGEGSVLSTAMGDVHWMAKTGNVLVHYGNLMAPKQRTTAGEIRDTAAGDFNAWSLIREFRHTRTPEIVWELVLGDPSGTPRTGWNLFGGDRLASLGN